MHRSSTSSVLRRAIFALVLSLSSLACSSVYDQAGTDGGASQRPGAPPLNADIDPRTDAPVGWASVNALGQNGTTGGGNAAPIVVNTIEELTGAVSGTTPAVVKIGTTMTGKVKIGSNKTVTAAPGVVYNGHLEVKTQSNVILRDLTIVGFNCTDNADCQSGADAVTITDAAHHVWVDHCAISNGSDGNLDVVHQSDYITISWTKFSYTGTRLGGHQFSNLIGSSDGDTGDAGHLRITWHHVWWADGVVERMPRGRFGLVHLFNNLYTSVGNSYCVGVGVGANFLLEDNDFVAVKNPINLTFQDATSVAVSFGNLYESGSLPSPNLGTKVFTPPYDYTLQPAERVQETVQANAGPSAK